MKVSCKLADPQAQSPLRILMVVPQYPFPVVGGLEKQAHELASELVRQGHRVSVLSGRVTADHRAVETLDGVEVHRVPWPRNRVVRGIASSGAFAAAFVRLARDADVVHCHVISSVGLLTISLARAARRPVLVKLAGHGTSGLGMFGRHLIRALRLMAFRRADAVVAMCGESLLELEEISFPRERILAISNGIRMDTPTRSRSARDDLTCRLLFVGRLLRQKGIFDLLDAMQVVRARRPDLDIRVDFAGDGEERAAVGAEVDARSLNGVVRLLGHVDGIVEAMPDYDALVLPSYGEGNSNVVLEAMACGLPVLSTRIGGTPMLVGEAGAPFLHEPGDAEALASLIQRIADAPVLRRALGAAMRARIEAHFDIRVVAQTYAAAYRLLANGQRSRIGELASEVVLTGTGVASEGFGSAGRSFV